MSRALNILQGRFGRVALLDMDRSLVVHAHRACHVLLKAGGADTYFDVNGTTCPLTGETAVLVNAWEPHAYTHRSSAPQALILALYIDPVWLASIDKRLLCSGHAGFFEQPCVLISPRIYRHSSNMSARMLLGDQFSTCEAEAAVFDLMIAVIERCMERAAVHAGLHRTTTISDHRIGRAIRHMRENLSKPLDAVGLAKVAGLSRPHFFCQFRRATGLTPGLFFNTLRMDAATASLTDSSRALIDVGQELGFDAQGNFTRFFRQHQGVAPSEYQRVTQLLF